jgi:hypothetical protein
MDEKGRGQRWPVQRGGSKRVLPGKILKVVRANEGFKVIKTV